MFSLKIILPSIAMIICIKAVFKTELFSYLYIYTWFTGCLLWTYDFQNLSVSVDKHISPIYRGWLHPPLLVQISNFYQFLASQDAIEVMSVTDSLTR